MAPAATTPGRKRQPRENQFFNPGVQGRKTGITLRRNSLDENGFEKLDGLFSSPEKSPPKRALPNGDTTLTSESMEVAKSSIPEPTEVLSTRRLLKSTKTAFPPPAGRSPYKTNIGSSPRRQSSVAPRTNNNRSSTPSNRATSQPAVNRRLDFHADEPQPSVESSPKRRSGGRRVTAQQKESIYDLPASKSPAPAANGVHEDYGHGEVIYEEETVANFEDTTMPLLVEEESLHIEVEAEEPEPLISSPVKAIKGKGKARTRTSIGAQANALLDAPVLKPRPTGRGRGKAVAGKQSEPSEVVEEPEPEPETAMPPPPPAAKKRGRPRRSDSIVQDPSIMEQPDASINEAAATPDPVAAKANTKKRGRPAKLPVRRDAEEEHQPTEDEEEEEPAKPAPKRQKKTSSRAPRELDANILMPPPAPAAKRATQSPSRMSTASRRSAARGQGRTLTTLQLLADPAEDAGMHKTRSGRTIIKPLQHWLGEKVERDLDGGMAGIYRAKEEELPRMQRGSSARPPTRKRQAYSRARDMSVLEEEEGSELLAEPWEERGDVLSAPMYQWDNERQETIDEQVQQEMAVSSRSMQPRQVQGGHFEYTKFMSTAFFGCGRLDLRPGGFKTKKNTRKMHQMFFVHEGKVIVTVNNAEFVISKGGVWYVPRGNFYSIRNDFEQPAKLIFAQGCEQQSSLDVYD